MPRPFRKLEPMLQKIWAEFNDLGIHILLNPVS